MRVRANQVREPIKQGFNEWMESLAPAEAKSVADPTRNIAGLLGYAETTKWQQGESTKRAALSFGANVGT